MTAADRRIALTFVVAGISAIFAEHLLKPRLRKGFRL